MKAHQVHEIDISEIKPSEWNPRTITPENAAALRASLEKFGLVDALQVDGDFKLLGGHQRYQQMIDAGYTGRVPVVVLRNLTDQDKQSLNIVLNNRHAQGEYTDDVVEILRDLEDDVPDLFVSMGLDDIMSDLDALSVTADEPIEKAPLMDEPSVEEPPLEAEVKTRCKPGQVWELGAHRLLCGDSLSLSSVVDLLDGSKADLLYTDPPYGVEYDGGQFSGKKPTTDDRRRQKLENDDSSDIYLKFIPNIPELVDGPCYIWFADRRARELYTAIGARLDLHGVIIWHKTNASYAALNAHYKLRHEPVAYCKPRGSTLRWSGPTNECSLWEIKADGHNKLHPTQKPVALAERAIGNHDASTVLDLFAGSGSTLIACENLGRACYAVEIDPGYCDVIISRWENHTQQEATLLE